MEEKLRKIRIYPGDITRLTVDVVVNAANSQLRGGGGVDGAIHRAAGPKLKEACMEIARKAIHLGELPCPVGDVRMTGGFNLPSASVFHTVGPSDRNSELLSKCYRNCLKLLRDIGARTIAFPCISTGAYGFPKLAAAKVATSTVLNWLDEPGNFDAVDLIIFCTPMDEDFYSSILCTPHMPCMKLEKAYIV